MGINDGRKVLYSSVRDESKELMSNNKKEKMNQKNSTMKKILTRNEISRLMLQKLENVQMKRIMKWCLISAYDVILSIPLEDT